MDKVYNVSDIHFDRDYLIINVNSVLYRIKISDASNKLVEATDSVKKDFKISPSGYGIHWNQIDEDLSINGLIRVACK